jgi:transposase-like protein
MTRKQNSAKAVDWKEVIGGQEDFLRPLIRAVVQQVLEAEMEEAVGAEKSERTSHRQGYRVGYYGRTLVTRGGQAGIADSTGPTRTVSGPRYSSAISAVKKPW